MNWARGVGYRPDNPVSGVRRYEENTTAWTTLTEKQADSLLEACGIESKRAPHLHLLVLLALHTGLRKGEALGLRWEDLDLSQGTVSVYRRKTNTRSQIPMHPRLLAALRTAKRRGPYLFAHKDGTPFGDARRSFKTAVNRAGLPDIRWHDLRHTFASWLVERGADLYTVQELMGHTSLSMTRRYAHLSPGHKRAAIELIGKREAARAATYPATRGSKAKAQRRREISQAVVE